MLLMLLLAAAISCAHGSSNPSVPAISGDTQVTATGRDSNSGHQLWGYWLIGVDPDTNQYEIFPVRQTEIHWNVLKWLEQGPCYNCLKVTSMTDSDHGTKLVTLSIKHPYESLNLTGFDVRGIAMFNGSHSFPLAGLTAPDRSQGDGELINADGYTTLYNSTTAGSGPGGLQGYLKGKFATPTMPDAQLNGFKRFVSTDILNTRDALYADDTVIQVYDIDMPDSPFVLGYAVDASWAPPTNKPVTDPMADFPPEANCYEPYGITITELGGILTGPSGVLLLEINVDDHQGPDSYAAPVLECPELSTDPIIAVETSPGKFEAEVHNTEDAPPGVYKVLFSVKDNENAGSPAWIDLTAYHVCTVQVHEEAGWAQTWGESNADTGTAAVTDYWGDVFVVGWFHGAVDFDPGPGSAVRNSINNSVDAFLSKFKPDGTFDWVTIWGGPQTDYAKDIAYDPSGLLYIVGEFTETVDFDPGSGVDEKTSLGSQDAYALCYSTDGVYYWTRTWGGAFTEKANSVLYKGGSVERVLVTGTFADTAFFPNGEVKVSNGVTDIYMVDIMDGHDLLGVWGGPEEDHGMGLTLDPVNNNLVAVTGSFSDDIDFDPEGMFGGRHSAGCTDAFISVYDISTDGTLPNQWIITWGDAGFDYSYNICAVPGSYYVTGSFMMTVDFDPGSNTDSRTASGFADAYVVHLGTAGEYFNVTTWGGDDGTSASDSGNDIVTDSIGNVYVVGDFAGEAFGIASQGKSDCVVAKYDPNLNGIWAAGWGGPEVDICYGVCVNQWDRIFITGYYQESADLNPGSGVDIHTSNGTQDCFLVKLLPTGPW